MPETLDLTNRRIAIKTPRGNITIGGQAGEIEGLWQIVRRELRTNAEVRELAGGVTYKTLAKWRRQGAYGLEPFPAPVVTFPGHHEPLELWSRTEVEEWLGQRAARAQ